MSLIVTFLWPCLGISCKTFFQHKCLKPTERNELVYILWNMKYLCHLCLSLLGWSVPSPSPVCCASLISLTHLTCCPAMQTSLLLSVLCWLIVAVVVCSCWRTPGLFFPCISCYVSLVSRAPCGYTLFSFLCVCWLFSDLDFVPVSSVVHLGPACPSLHCTYQVVKIFTKSTCFYQSLCPDILNEAYYKRLRL